MVDVAVIMPVYNERACLHQVIEEWVALLKPLDGVLVLCDDGSTDGSDDVCREWQRLEPQHVVARRHENVGHGPTVYWGYRYALDELRACYVAQADSDGQFPPAGLDELLKHRRGGVVLGIRRDRQDPLIRRLLSKAMRRMNYALFGVWVEDANCPVRVIWSGYLERVLPMIPPMTFAPNVLLSLRAAKDGRLFTKPIPHRPRATGTVTINRRLLTVCLRNLVELLAFRRNGFRRALDDRTRTQRRH